MRAGLDPLMILLLREPSEDVSEPVYGCGKQPSNGLEGLGSAWSTSITTLRLADLRERPTHRLVRGHGVAPGRHKPLGALELLGDSLRLILRESFFELGQVVRLLFLDMSRERGPEVLECRLEVRVRGAEVLELVQENLDLGGQRGGLSLCRIPLRKE